jgi:transcriptional regulator with XRE-family HTH domain
MTDLSHITSLSDAAIIKEIGAFIKARRIDHHLTQDDVAEQAAISRSTLSLIERGENTALINLIKILRVLDALYVLGRFERQQSFSPLQLAKEEEKKRKRARRKSSTQKDKDNVEW